MTRFNRYMLKEARKAGTPKLMLGLVASVLLLALMILMVYEKASMVWPPETALTTASGRVTGISADQDSIHFKLSGSKYAFEYDPLYGRKWQAVQQALTQTEAPVIVKFILETGKNELGIERKYQSVLALTVGSRPVLTYVEAQHTFETDSLLGPVLLAFAIICTLMFSYSLYLMKKYVGIYPEGNAP